MTGPSELLTTIERESVNTIAHEVRGPRVAALARCNREDIERAARALEPAAKPRLHVFLATSAIHRQYKLKMAKEEIVRTAIEGVTIARRYCDDVEFSPEDAARTEPEFLARAYKELADLRLRGRLSNGCIGLLTFCAFLIGITIILLFLGETTNFQSNRLAVAGFLAGVASFLLALVCFLTETLLATRVLDFHMLQREVENQK